MADNVTVDNGTGTDYVVASDDDGTAQHQYMKVEFGADNTQTKVTSSAGLPVKIVESGTATPVTQSGTWTVQPGNTANTTAWKVDGSAVTQPISVASAVAVTDNSGSLTVDNGGTFATQAAQSGTWTVQPGNTANTTAWKVDGSAVTQPVSGTVAVTNSDVTASAASLSVVDDWDESDRAKVNPIAGQAGVAAGSGTVSALTQRVVLATDVALPAGTNGIGKLTANSGVDIGDVDVTSVAGTVTTKETRAATSALTTVSDTASSTSILASNSNRLKAVITNDSSARLHLRFEAAAASTSNYMVSLGQHETWEELNYTGEIRGIWATDPNDGAARVTEFTA